jgi:ribosome biogenesis protein MAK21
MDARVKTEKPDLESHSLIRFLDKFAYRNPKTKEATRGGSIMQPLQTGSGGSDIWLRSKSAQASGTTVNNASFWSKKIENVAAEDVFFHEYFSQTGRATAKPTAKAAVEEDVEAGDEDEVWKVLTAGHDEDEDALDDIDEDDESDLPDWDSSDDSAEGEDLGGDESLWSDVEMGEEDDAEGDAEDGDDADGGEDVDAEEDESKKPKPKSRRQQLRELPMFASVDDYADLLAQEEEQ